MAIGRARSCRVDVANIHLPTPRELPPSSRRSGLTLCFIRQSDVDSRSRRDFSTRRRFLIGDHISLSACMQDETEVLSSLPRLRKRQF